MKIDEWQSFWVGFAETACPWPARRGISDKYFKEVMEKEQHYYVMGRFFGELALLGVVIGFAKVTMLVIRGVI